MFYIYPLGLQLNKNWACKLKFFQIELLNRLYKHDLKHHLFF